MELKKLYKIRVKTLEGRIITFTKVKGYAIKDGLISFVDSFNGNHKQFAVSNCEIEPEVEDKNVTRT